MNRATKIVAAVLVALSLGLAVLAIVLGRQSSPPEVVVAAPVADPAPSYPVVVADAELPVGQPIEARQLKVVNLSIFPPGTNGDIDAFVGKKPVRAIPVGRPIYESDLGAASPLSFAMTDGERAIALTVEEIGGGSGTSSGGPNRISAGDFVDVFFSLKDQSNVGRSQVRLLLSRVRVLVYGSGVTDNLAVAQSGPVTRPAVLVVPLPDVPRLLLATQHGRVVLALRAPGDDAVADVNLFHQPGPALAPRPGLNDAQRASLREPSNQAYAGMSLGGLVNLTEESVPASPSPVPVPPAVSPASPTPRQAPRAAPTRQVEIIRGTQTEVVPF
ncbi:Flp pilus assembly protein CpaB [Pigmentiphaga aceris]|uniref:Flp pilus assembly protein CpaB n=1 Tax=Pigmentiphaga aceris TaxID=1940612 RepID=A0A5C0AW93_9BURK|nr:Flp pilus assembly protein CpaB [Pigmentiphaga aceris]QEI05643.1 Flp pilus assembly protein CpaB [Pigmentiphaga aceris]